MQSPRLWCKGLIPLLLLIRSVTAAVKTPATLPPTNPQELFMIYGTEEEPIVDDVWTVPYQHYRLTKVKMWKNGQATSGFEVTFSPPESYIGWSSISHFYGTQELTDNINERSFTDEIESVEVCSDGYLSGGNNNDFEGFKFKEVGK